MRLSEKSSFQDFRNNSLKPIGRWVSVYLNQYFRAFDFWHFSDSLRMEIMTQEELEEFLSKPILARIATVGKNCTPHIAPVWFIYDNGAIMIGTLKKTKKIRNIKNNPAVAVAIDTIVGESVSGGAKGAIFQGKAELVEKDTLQVVPILFLRHKLLIFSEIDHS